MNPLRPSAPGSPQSKPRLLIVGASARAAAESAARAGFSPYAVDLFGDADLAARFPSSRVSDLADASLPLPPLDGFIYTGGMENRPDAVAAWTRRASLRGNGPAALRLARDPVAWGAALAGLHPMILPPEIRASGVVPVEGRWLWKRRSSAGGLGVVAAEPGRSFPSLPEFDGDSALLPAESLAHPAGWILQRRYVGPTHAGLFFAGAQGVVFLGATRQLAGEAWCNAARFHYCGSIGPLLLHPAEAEAWKVLGEASARFAGLSGLFGIDAVRPPLVAGASHPFRPLVPVDLNPRYTASVEVLERAFGGSALALLRPELPAAWPAAPASNVACSQVVGKAVVFADSARVVAASTSDVWMRLSRAGGRGDEASRADVPHPGTAVGAGEPIVSVFSEGMNLREALQKLRAEAAAALAESIR